MRILLAQFYSHQPTPDYEIIVADLRKRGYEAWLATPDSQGNLLVTAEDQLVATVPAIQEPTGRFATMPIVRKLLWKKAAFAYQQNVRKMLRRLQPDIVQVNPARLDRFETFPLRMPNSMKFILDMRQIDEREYGNGLVGKIKAVAHRFRRKMVARHSYSSTAFLHSAGAEKVLGEQWQKWGYVVPLGVAARFLQQPRSAKKTDDPNAKTTFVYLGTISTQRKLDLLFLAAQKILQHTDNFEIVFIGPDATKGYYQTLIAEMGLQDVITIKAPISYADVPGVLVGYDVAIAIVPERPLDWQYHPTLKALEYRALGIPMIATDFEPNREIVENGRNGLLINNSVDEIAAAMLRYVQDQDFMAQSRNDAIDMRQGLLWQDVVDKYITYYTFLLTEHGATTPQLQVEQPTT